MTDDTPKTFHPVAAIFPLMDAAQLDELALHIIDVGLLEPIVLHPDRQQIIDGRNRYLACQQAGIVPTYRVWKGDGSIVQFAVGLNLHRRQLTIAQRALVGARIASLQLGANQHTSPDVSSAAIGADNRDDLNARPEDAALLNVRISDAAKLAGTSSASVQRGRQVLAHALPELLAEVEAGTVTIAAAARVAMLPPPEQQAIVRQGAPAVAHMAEVLRAGGPTPRAVAVPASAPRPRVAKTQVAVAARWATVRTMAAEGYNSAQIAEAVGIGWETCKGQMSRLKIACPGDRGGSAHHIDGARILDHIAVTAEGLIDEERLIDFARLDMARLADWIVSLSKSHRNFGAFIARLRERKERYAAAQISSVTTHVQDPPGAARHDGDPDRLPNAAPVHSGARQRARQQPRPEQARVSDHQPS